MYAGTPYAGGAYAGAGMVVADIPADVEPTFSVEVSFATDALATPAWVDISGDVRAWDVSRGRSRELERFQPGRATVVLDNSSRAYDSNHATSPWFGNLRPMRRIRIRETFSGVTYPRFDGYVDRWLLDYPEYGTDAIATVDATDGFKILARTDLAKSVYFDTVEADAPAIWWRLDDNQVTQGDVAATALNWGTLGAAADGTFVGPPTLGGPALVVHDPGGSMETTDSTASPGTTDMGVRIAQANFDLAATGSWAIEMWARPGIQDATTNFAFAFGIGTAANADVQIIYDNIVSFQGLFENSVGTGFTTSTGGIHPPHEQYHVVLKHGPDRRFAIYVNGVGDATPATTTGTLDSGDSRVGYRPTYPTLNWVGTISNFAVYTAATAVDPLSDARIAAHYAAGTTPWSGDLPGARAGRVLDEAAWPADLRELDAGQTTLQSAATDGQTALEHAHKVSETEFGNFFVTRAGVTRLIARDPLDQRVSAGTFGDGAGEVGYRRVEFDDGDQTIRNSVTISRLNGVARTAEDAASIAGDGRFQYTLDGLLHNTEAHSIAYAQTIVDSYHEPARRVTSMELGPAAAGEETALYTQMLGRELADLVTVKCRPPGGGAVFTQDVVIEGMTDRWDPHSLRTATWTLGAEPADTSF